ncbi:hypothetical protein ABZX92_07055 [Lentzea sp. NPDC006480]|uniref:hypothetical protein n=1 Tax=Lentzea sp. NPDC006480 TaxID=3157176 RepID=UPI0033AF9EB1
MGEAAADWFTCTAIRGYRADTVDVVVGPPAFLLTPAFEHRRSRTWGVAELVRSVRELLVSQAGSGGPRST